MPVRSLLLRVGFVAAVLAVLVPLPSRVAAQVAATLDAETSASYVVRPEEGRVEVRFSYAFENRTTDVAFPGFFESLPADATGVVAADDRRELAAAEVGDEDGFTVWLVAFDDPLDPGEQVTVTLDWVLVPGADGSRPILEEGAVAFDVYAPGSDGATWHPATVDVPDGFVPADPTPSTELGDGWVQWQPEMDAPYQRVEVAFTDRSRFVTALVDAPPALTVADWTEGGDWLTSVLKRGFELVPTLDTWFGPRVEPIEIRRGLAGDDHPELALDASPAHVTVAGDSVSAIDHQLAHAWMADVPVDEAWFLEGLAAAFAGDAAVPSGPAEIMAPLADEIGPSGVRAVVDALRSSAITYPGTEPEPQPLPADWRTLLDLLEGVGGAGDDAAPLFRSAVVDAEGAAEIDRRGAARVDYAALAARAEPWTLPPLLRFPMAEWDFDTFAARQGAVSDALLLRDSLDAWARDLGLASRDDVRLRFESADTGMADVTELLHDRREALEAFDEAERLVNGDRGLLARVGLIRSDPDADLAELRDLWAEGDYAAVARGGRELADLVEGAVGAGTVRLLIPVIVAVGVWRLLRWALRRSRPRLQVVDS